MEKYTSYYAAASCVKAPRAYSEGHGMKVTYCTISFSIYYAYFFNGIISGDPG